MLSQERSRRNFLKDTPRALAALAALRILNLNEQKREKDHQIRRYISDRLFPPTQQDIIEAAKDTTREATAKLAAKRTLLTKTETTNTELVQIHNEATGKDQHVIVILPNKQITQTLIYIHSMQGPSEDYHFWHDQFAQISATDTALVIPISAGFSWKDNGVPILPAPHITDNNGAYVFNSIKETLQIIPSLNSTKLSLMGISMGATIGTNLLLQWDTLQKRYNLPDIQHIGLYAPAFKIGLQTDVKHLPPANTKSDFGMYTFLA
jgi:hypothetical protein